MKLLLEAIQKLASRIGEDAAALSGEDVESAALIPFVEAAETRIGALVDGQAAFIQGLPDSLSLSDDATLEDALAAINAKLSKAEGDALSLSEMTTRLQVLESGARDRLIADLRAEGKLTEAMLPWAQKQDSAALTDWAKTAPVAVPPQRIIVPGTEEGGDDTLALSDADIKVAKACGLDPAKVAAANNLKYEA